MGFHTRQLFSQQAKMRGYNYRVVQFHSLYSVFNSIIRLAISEIYLTLILKLFHPVAF